MIQTAAISLGGNVGDVQATFAQALAALDRLPAIQLVSRSRHFSTRPMGINAGETFLNEVALLQAACSPEELFREMARIELSLGRQRTVHWGPRTLDLDLISFGQERIAWRLPERGAPVPLQGDRHPGVHRPQAETATLIVPHPACWYRRFVLDPWCDVAPHWRHPVLNETVRDMHERICQRPLRISVSAADSELAEQFLAELELASLMEEVIRLPEGDRAAEMHFVFLDESTPAGREFAARHHCPRTIRLSADRDGILLGLQILQSALDDVMPIEESK